MYTKSTHFSLGNDKYEMTGGKPIQLLVTKPSEAYVLSDKQKASMFQNKKQVSKQFAEFVRKPNIVMGYKDDKINSTHRSYFRGNTQQGKDTAMASKDMTSMKEHWTLGHQRSNFATTTKDSFTTKQV